VTGARTPMKRLLHCSAAGAGGASSCARGAIAARATAASVAGGPAAPHSPDEAATLRRTPAGPPCIATGVGPRARRSQTGGGRVNYPGSGILDAPESGPSLTVITPPISGGLARGGGRERTPQNGINSNLPRVRGQEHARAGEPRLDHELERCDPIPCHGPMAAGTDSIDIDVSYRTMRNGWRSDIRRPLPEQPQSLARAGALAHLDPVVRVAASRSSAFLALTRDAVSPSSSSSSRAHSSRSRGTVPARGQAPFSSSGERQRLLSREPAIDRRAGGPRPRAFRAERDEAMILVVTTRAENSRPQTFENGKKRLRTLSV
jgi:hypothetical protein